MRVTSTRSCSVPPLSTVSSVSPVPHPAHHLPVHWGRTVTGLVQALSHGSQLSQCGALPPLKTCQSPGHLHEKRGSLGKAPRRQRPTWTFPPHLQGPRFTFICDFPPGLTPPFAKSLVGSALPCSCLQLEERPPEPRTCTRTRSPGRAPAGTPTPLLLPRLATRSCDRGSHPQGRDAAAQAEAAWGGRLPPCPAPEVSADPPAFGPAPPAGLDEESCGERKGADPCDLRALGHKHQTERASIRIASAPRWERPSGAPSPQTAHGPGEAAPQAQSWAWPGTASHKALDSVLGALAPHSTDGGAEPRAPTWRLLPGAGGGAQLAGRARARLTRLLGSVPSTSI